MIEIIIRYPCVYLSIASPWEMQIKSQLGKLSLQISLAELVETNINTNNINLLAIDFKHIHYLSQLPLHHNDPFDRIIIAQAITEDMSIISVDSAFEKYPVARIW